MFPRRSVRLPSSHKPRRRSFSSQASVFRSSHERRLAIEPLEYRALLAATVVTGLADSISATGATLNATVNPDASAASAVFQYSTDRAFTPTVVQTLGAGFKNPRGVAVDTFGDVFIADTDNSAVKEILPSGLIKTLGSGFNGPSSVAVDAAGDVYVADTFNDAVKYILPNGTTQSINASFNIPEGVADDTAGHPFVADTFNNAVEKITPFDQLQTIGSGFNGPSAVAVDAAGDVFVADTGNNAIKEITINGSTQTLGSGFQSPRGVAVNTAGDVFVADTGNNAVKEILPNGHIETVGSGFSSPDGVAVDTSGDVFVADTGHSRIVELSCPTVVATPSVLMGSTAMPVKGTLIGLTPGTTYYYRAVVFSAAGTVVDARPPESFITDLPPVVVTGSANSVSATGATINASVNPEGQTTETVFQFSTNAAFPPTLAQPLGTGFNTPYGVAVDMYGDVFVADTLNNDVKEILSDGATQTVGAGFDAPEGVTVDAAGYVYVADTFNNAVKEILPSGDIVTLSTGFSRPRSVTVDAAGDVFVADAKGVEEILPDNAVQTIATGFTNATGVAVDAAGDVFVADAGSSAVDEIPHGGVLRSLGVGFNGPFGVAVDTIGDVFAADTGNNAIKEIANGGAILTLGSGFSHPQGVTVDAHGDVFVADTGFVSDTVSGRVVELSLPFVNGMPSSLTGSTGLAVSGTLTDLTPGTTYYYRAVASNAAGIAVDTQQPPKSFTTLTAPTVVTGPADAISATGATLNATVNPDGSAASAVFQYSTDPAFTPTVSQTIGSGYAPGSVAVNAAGDVFVTDLDDNALKVILPDGTTHTVATGFNYPVGVAVDEAGDLFVADDSHNAVKEILPNGTVQTIGSGFNNPEGVAVDAVGDVFVADTAHNVVKEFLPNGQSQTIGSGFLFPTCVAVDAAGDVFVADYNNNAVKEVLPGGGIKAIGSGFKGPAGVAVDAAGDVFVADYLNGAIKEILPNDIILTLGSGFSDPFGVAVDAVGDVFVADGHNKRVVELSPPTVAAAPASLSGSTATAATATLTGLSPGTTYYYRAVVFSAAGVVADTRQPPESFTTLNALDPLTGATTSLANGGVEGATAATLTGATFADANTAATSADFNVTAVDWGDGSSTTAGLSVSGSGGDYTVAGSHLYAEEGTHSFRITVSDASGNKATITGSAHVADAALSATASAVSAAVGSTFSGTVATFSDANSDATANDFTAVIDWGDGTTSAGTVAPVAGGGFQVAGAHLYSNTGTEAITVLVNDVGGSPAAAVSSATVVAAGKQQQQQQQYVAAVFQDVLGRAPDSAGLAYWTNLLNQGTAISNVAQAIGTSDEYYARFVIEPDYLKLLGRAADEAGVMFWTKEMDGANGNVTDQQLAADLVSSGGSSGEFYRNAGGTDLAWIDAVYKLLLGRAADAAGEMYWSGLLNMGETLNKVAQGIAGSQENNTQLINDDYMHYLGRAADPTGLAYWLGQFADGATNEGVIAGFTGSAEYYKEHTS